MGCHSQVQKDSPKLEPLRQGWVSGKGVPWVQIHKTPDHAYFNHAVHINRGVSCVECHGRVDQMDVVYQAKSLTMNFCLECHRAPENALRPLDKVTDLGWKAPTEANELASLLGTTPDKLKLKAGDKLTLGKAQKVMGEHFKVQRGVQPPVSNCAGCHR
jgi:formate-dependent nitrite reductase cytochrome c552 subunit